MPARDTNPIDPTQPQTFHIPATRDRSALDFTIPPAQPKPATYTYLDTRGVLHGLLRINTATGAIETLEHTPAGWVWQPVPMAK
jgi:hypothetical protein